MPGDSLTVRLARFVVETREIPFEVLQALNDALIDTFAAGFAGAREPCTSIALRTAVPCDGVRRATVWGHVDVVAPQDAAFVNGVAAHALDFDDTLASMRGHSSVTTVPVAMALGESRHASGIDVLTALALGLEVAGKLGQVFGHGHYLRGWHSTATIGTFAATAVAARLMHHDATTLCNAWGLAAAQASGLVRNFGTMAKPFQAGHAARAGFVSAQLAGAGMTADTRILDGKNSVLEIYSADGLPLAESLAELGARWEAIDPGLNVKRWPCCYCSHRAIGGLIEMMDDHAVRADEVESITVGFAPGSDEPLIYSDPKTGLEGKFSIEYPLAALLLDGRLTPSSFTDDMVARPAVRAMMKRIRRTRVEDTRTYSGTIGYTDLDLRTTRGRFQRRIDKAPGAREWPMSVNERREKFLDCASIVLASMQAQAWLATAEKCVELSDISELARLSIPAQQRTREQTPAGASKGAQ
jgi:2-methylcitrate dehydratase PrpD